MKLIKTFAVLALVAIVTTSVDAQIVDYNSYLNGLRQARRDNWEDARRAQELRQMQLKTQEMQRQRAIADNISAFNTTGDYKYLCVAAGLGSLDAANFLSHNGVRCSKQKQPGLW